MAGPNKPSNQNNNQNDNKKKAPIGFLGIVTRWKWSPMATISL